MAEWSSLKMYNTLVQGDKETWHAKVPGTISGSLLSSQEYFYGILSIRPHAYLFPTENALNSSLLSICNCPMTCSFIFFRLPWRKSLVRCQWSLTPANLPLNNESVCQTRPSAGHRGQSGTGGQDAVGIQIRIS